MIEQLAAQIENNALPGDCHNANAQVRADPHHDGGDDIEDDCPHQRIRIARGNSIERDFDEVRSRDESGHRDRHHHECSDDVRAVRAQVREQTPRHLRIVRLADNVIRRRRGCGDRFWGLLCCGCDNHHPIHTERIESEPNVTRSAKKRTSSCLSCKARM